MNKGFASILFILEEKIQTMQNIKSLLYLILGVVLILPQLIWGQAVQTVAFTPNNWEVNAKHHEFNTFKGKSSLYLENGKARLKDIEFDNGIIEFDLHVAQNRMFAGVHFHIQGPGNYEEYYIRPHQSGNPDAMQYTPVFNGIAGWQLYHGPGYSNNYNFSFGEWMHVKLVIAGSQMQVFINDMAQPILNVPELKMGATEGQIGFGTFLGGAHYANLSYQKMDRPQFVGTMPDIPKMEVGTIPLWQVSAAFDKNALKNIHQLSGFSKYKDLEWRTLASENSGTVNLAQRSPIGEDQNTLLVKTTIQSKEDQVIPMDFGYSDEVVVFVNGIAFYSGHNRFRTRDYRYLGTIGYFDTLFLPLKKGDNELVFAVTEAMGGWGLSAKIKKMEGISYKSR